MALALELRGDAPDLLAPAARARAAASSVQAAPAFEVAEPARARPHTACARPRATSAHLARVRAGLDGRQALAEEPPAAFTGGGDGRSRGAAGALPRAHGAIDRAIAALQSELQLASGLCIAAPVRRTAAEDGTAAAGAVLVAAALAPLELVSTPVSALALETAHAQCLARSDSCNGHQGSCVATRWSAGGGQAGCAPRFPQSIARKPARCARCAR